MTKYNLITMQKVINSGNYVVTAQNITQVTLLNNFALTLSLVFYSLYSGYSLFVTRTKPHNNIFPHPHPIDYITPILYRRKEN